eukprot:gene7470-9177_t
MEHKKFNIVLVHGAWADGGSYAKVIPHLMTQGYNVISTQHPMTSLTDDVNYVKQICGLLEGPILLVGHSYGGAICVEVASQVHNVKGIVFVAAFAPENGESLGDLLAKNPTEGGKNIFPDKNGFLWIKKEKFGESFACDGSKEEIMVMSSTQMPINKKCFEEKVKGVGSKNLPTWFQISDNDNMIHPNTQKFMAERMKSKTFHLKSSHASLVTHGKEISEIVLQAANSISSQIPQV